MRDGLIKFLATGFGVGYLPKAPGTAGSVLGIGLWWLVKEQPVVYAVIAVAAVWVAGAAARSFQQADPGCVVIDEIVGMPLVLVGLMPAGWQIVAGFVLFRVFDIWKPFPIRQSQRLPGGWGIVVDDLLAGLAACVVLHAVTRLVS